MTRRRLIDSSVVSGPAGPELQKRSTHPAGRELLRAESDRLRDIDRSLTRSRRGRLRHLTVPVVLDTRDVEHELVVRLGVAAGTTLAALHPVSPDRLMSIFGVLEAAVDELHALGWSHGRLRADHVIITDDDSVTLCSWSDATTHGSGAPLDRQALRQMFIDVGGDQLRLHDERQLSLRRRILSATDAAPTSRAGPIATATRATRPSGAWPSTPTVTENVTLRALVWASALCGSAIPLLWHITGRPSLVPITLIGGDPMAAVVEVTTWIAYALCCWTAATCGLAAGARIMHWERLHAGALRCSPFRRRGASILLAGSVLVTGVGTTARPTERPTSSHAPQDVAVPPHATTMTRPPPPGTTIAIPARDGHPSPTPAGRSVASGPEANGSAPTGGSTREPHPLGQPSRATTGDDGPGRDHGAARTPTPDRPESTHPAPADWRVEPGDHLWSIAERLTPGADDTTVHRLWTDLIRANRDRLINADDPDLLLPGQVLVIPPIT